MIDLMKNYEARCAGSKWFSQYRNKLGRERHLTFELLYVMACERNLKTIVETGCMRKPLDEAWGGDGASTVILADLAFLLDGKFESVDMDPKAVSIATDATSFVSEYVTIYCNDSIRFLDNIIYNIDIAYLDSGNDDELQIKELNTIYNKLHKDSIILLDDIPTKGTKAINFLVDKGWIIHTLLYQSLIVHPDSLNKNYADGSIRANKFYDIKTRDWDNIRRRI
jgi:predicted O-methyltransferase YrrM